MGQSAATRTPRKENPVKPRIREITAGIAGFLKGLHPAKLALLGYLSYLVLGWLLLCVQFLQRGRRPSQHANASQRPTRYLCRPRAA